MDFPHYWSPSEFNPKNRARQTETEIEKVRTVFNRILEFDNKSELIFFEFVTPILPIAGNAESNLTWSVRTNRILSLKEVGALNWSTKSSIELLVEHNCFRTHCHSPIIRSRSKMYLGHFYFLFLLLLHFFGDRSRNISQLWRSGPKFTFFPQTICISIKCCRFILSGHNYHSLFDVIIILYNIHNFCK